MYCGQCGKKVMEDMLFCPFCGSPIVIPDQEEERSEVPVQETPVATAKTTDAENVVAEKKAAKVEEAPMQANRPVSLFDSEAQTESMADVADTEKFVPLSFDFESQLRESEVRNKTQNEARYEAQSDDAETEKSPENVFSNVKPQFRDNVRGTGRDERYNRGQAPSMRKNVNTYVPMRDVDIDNMFMDEDDDEADDYDFEEETLRHGRYRDEFEYEEPEIGGFFQRHIRGFVGLILFLVLALIFIVWMFSGKGQLALARVNLAWTAEPYADLGYEAYQLDSDLLAARYYEKAFARDSTNYEYAHSAMVAYYEAEEIESAAAMLKKCVEMNPDDPEPYQEMLILYPDAQTRPWEITELIRLGYQRTGDEALKLN